MTAAGLDLGWRPGSTPALVTLIGGAKVVVGPEVRVEVGGFSLVGGTRVHVAD